MVCFYVIMNVVDTVVRSTIKPYFFNTMVYGIFFKILRSEKEKKIKIKITKKFFFI